MKNLMMILVVAIFIALATGAPHKQPKHTDDFLTFWDLHKIEHYLEDLDEDYDFVHLESIGTTSEGRPIHALKVAIPHLREPKHHKPIIMIESGLHAREWVAPMVNLYLIHMLVEHYPEYDHILQNVDFLFVPMANPDGYQYSRENDRNWNKNRRRVGRSCYGVDLNRNFDFQFIATSDPCDEHFAGRSAASEAETKGIQELLEKHDGRISMYLSLQAFGQQILTPFNYAPEVGQNHQELISLGEEVAKKIHSYNDRTYTYGAGGRLLENPEHGTSSDYAYGAKNVPLAFTIKLPGGGENGYEVSEDQLDGILTETWFGFLEFVEYVEKPNWVPY